MATTAALLRTAGIASETIHFGMSGQALIRATEQDVAASASQPDAAACTEAQNEKPKKKRRKRRTRRSQKEEEDVSLLPSTDLPKSIATEHACMDDVPMLPLTTKALFPTSPESTATEPASISTRRFLLEDKHVNKKVPTNVRAREARFSSSDDTDCRNLARNWQDAHIFQPGDVVITAEQLGSLPLEGGSLQNLPNIVITEQQLVTLGYTRGGLLDWQRALLRQQYQMLGEQRVGLKILVRTLDARGDVELHDLAARSLADVELHMMYITTLVHPEALEADYVSHLRSLLGGWQSA